ncbi:MAG TPA: hypothetical protein VK988_08775 [Acidimicrobiales bacterium]|nr:hypothetical protein [Acidimicrobiales bacterium]
MSDANSTRDTLRRDEHLIFRNNRFTRLDATDLPAMTEWTSFWTGGSSPGMSLTVARLREAEGGSSKFLDYKVTIVIRGEIPPQTCNLYTESFFAALVLLERFASLCALPSGRTGIGTDLRIDVRRLKAAKNGGKDG